MYKKPTRYIVYFLEFKIQSFSLTGHLGSEHHSIVALGGGAVTLSKIVKGGSYLPLEKVGVA